MRETWYYIVAEFKALGLRCIMYGPEFWLGITGIAIFLCLIVIVSIINDIRK